MKTFNYRIIVEPDERTGTNKPCFTAYCPTLGLADDGDTLQEALENIKRLINFHIENLAAEGKEIPFDETSKDVITSVSVEVPIKQLQPAA